MTPDAKEEKQVNQMSEEKEEKVRRYRAMVCLHVGFDGTNLADPEPRSVVLASDHDAELSRVCAERDAMREDAERYRYLRQPNNCILYARDPHAWGKDSPGHVAWKTPEQLDAAIDAALAKASP